MKRWQRNFEMRRTRWPRAGWLDYLAVSAVLRSIHWGGYPYPGPRTQAFTAGFAALHDMPHVVATSSGSTALMAAYQALGLLPGDEVILPALTFSATASSASLLGLEVIFVDVDPHTLCLDPRAVEAAITPRTRAITAVHLGDSMPDMDALAEIAHRHRLHLIEDCAHAHGASWRHRPVGGIGDVGCFSFQSSKLISAGEGGAITVRDLSLAQACIACIDCGRLHGGLQPAQSRLGINLRLTEFQAALLATAIKRFPGEQAIRQRRMESLRDQLMGVKGIGLPTRDPRMTARPAYAFQLLYQPDHCGGVPRSRFLVDLNTAGFPVTSCWYDPVYRAPEYGLLDQRLRRSRSLPNCPVAEWASSEALVWIPHPFFLGPQRWIDQFALCVMRLVESYRAEALQM